METVNNYPVLYGIWVPGKGWVRGAGNQAIMFTHKFIAKETAKRIRQNAKVYFIDQSLVDIEDKLLEAEQTDFFSPWFLFDLKRLAKMLTRR